MAALGWGPSSRTIAAPSAVAAVLTALVATAALSGPAFAQAPTCGRESFSKVVEDAAAGLRRHSSETQPRIQAGISQLKARHSWRDEEQAERARELLADAET